MTVKVNFGCGAEGKLPGWINVDLCPGAAPDVVADLAKDLPFATASVDFIHTEDFIAALELDQAKHFLRECARILKPTGVMRVLTPDLARLCQSYLEQPAWLVATWDRTVGVPLATRSACEVVNLGVRLAGRFHYDAPTFRQVAAECGLRAEEVSWNQSEHAELRNLDLRAPESSVSMYFQCYPEVTGR
ncbi:MAG: methyltransferase domain-containing protein [Casimicrobiaceae bacterium]